MESLKCNRCGGTIVCNSKTQEIICESCGTRQTLRELLSGENPLILNTTKSDFNRYIESYFIAVQNMQSAKTASDYDNLADEFEKILGIFNSKELQLECKNRATELKRIALVSVINANINSNNYTELRKAIAALKETIGYNITDKEKLNYEKQLADTENKYQECIEKVKKASLKKAARKKAFIILIAVVLFLVFAGKSFIQYWSYSASRIHISFQPKTYTSIEKENENYVFTYNVSLENKGIKDIRSLEVTVSMEDEDNIIVETKMSFYNNELPVVRAGKSVVYEWRLTVSSAEKALILHEKAEQLQTHFKITGASYTNGVFKNY